MNVRRAHAVVAIALCCSAVAYGQTTAYDQYKECQARTSDRAFDPIRSVFALTSEQVSESLTRATGTPSPAQRASLALYRAKVTECVRGAIAKMQGGWQDTYQSKAADLRFDLLMQGKITFGDYALLAWADVESTKGWMAAVDKAKAQAVQDSKAAVGLACSFSSDPLVGVELFVQFDEQSQRVVVGRGGDVKSAWVNQAEVGFVQAMGKTIISRLTGTFATFSEGVGAVARGTCKQVTQRLF